MRIAFFKKRIIVCFCKPTTNPDTKDTRGYIMKEKTLGIPTVFDFLGQLVYLEGGKSNYK